MRLPLWPKSLFGRLIAASVLAVLLAQITGLVLVARERESFVLQGNVREWSRRIAEVTYMLQPMSPEERAAAVNRLVEQPRHFERMLAGMQRRSRVGSAPGADERALEPGPPPGGRPGPAGPPRPFRPPYSSQIIFIPLPIASDFEATFRQQLHATLGSGYTISVTPSNGATRHAIPISTPFYEPREGVPTQLYDVKVRFPDGYDAVFRVTRTPRGAQLSRSLFINLGLLVVILVIALYVMARSITRPISNLASAAEGLGRNIRQPKLDERGGRELQHAARAFNTMQDRLQRYLDSRTRVLAAMSHDLKTPLTRLRLQVETYLEDPSLQARFSKELDEMESMVRGALALFRGLDDDETLAPVDINSLVAAVRADFTEMGANVTVYGHAREPFVGKPQALKRLLTNLVANAVKFGTRAEILIEDETALIIRVRDNGTGIPVDELERVFEPFYRVESSRNRDTGGTGLGLSIARDVAQAHGGSLVAQNLPGHGLEALLVLPRQR